MVRPYAQTSKTSLLARGPKVAQASTVNSASADMNLAAKEVGGAALLRAGMAGAGRYGGPRLNIQA